MNTGGLTDLSALFRRAPGQAELAALLDLLPDAALLVELRGFRILAANNPACEFTGLPRSELESQPLSRILPELTPAAFQHALRNRTPLWQTPLKTRTARPSRIQARFHALGPRAPFGVFILTPAVSSQPADGEMLTQRFESFPLLARAALEPELPAAIQAALQAGQLLTGATTLAYYQIEMERQHLCRKHAWGLIDDLPEKLPIGEVEHLRLPYIWTPGTRPTSLLHQRALAAQYSYLASIPIHPVTPFEGLLIVADQIAEPPHFLESLLETLAAILLTADTHHRRLRTLELKLNRQTETMNHTESIQDMVNDGLVFITPELRITDLNSKAEAMFGYTQDEVYGRPLVDVLVANGPLLGELHNLLADPTPLDLGQMRLTRRDGQTLLAHLRVKPYHSGGILQRLALLITDLSQQEDFDRRSRQLEDQAQLGELTAILAHEIRNPINNISAALQLMEISITSAEDPIRAQIQPMMVDLERIEQLMKSVLSFASSRNYEMKPLNLNQFLEGLLHRWRARAARQQVEINAQLPTFPIHISADRIALEQVFTNLISNALEAIQGTGNVIGLRVAPSQHTGELNLVEINISDSGPGIQPELLEEIFNPFFTTKARGTGLGLAITRRIINAHNGRIQAESFPSGGTLFSIKLPMQLTPPTPGGENR